MARNKGYAAYANNKVLTASPGELTLMLYEGAIKFCNIAIIGIEEKDYGKANSNILKAEAIIEEFQATLNMDYEISKDLDEIYSYLYKRLVEANIKKDIEILQEVLQHLRTLRDTWKEAIKLTANGSKIS